MDLTKALEAVKYLQEHKYGHVLITEDRLFFRRDSGDGSWEGIADENGWMREQYDICCRQKMEEDKGELFCFCGRGINNLVSWARVPKHLASAEMEKILYKGIPMRDQIFND